MDRCDFSSIMTCLKNHISESNQMNQPEFLYEVFEDFMDSPESKDFSFDNGLVCRWMTGQAKISPKISTYYAKLSITLKFCTFFTLKKCTDITVFSLRVIHLFPLVDNFHQQSLLLWNDEGFYQVLPLIWYYLGICPAILRSFCLL